MDPVTLIVAALGAGLSTIGQATLGEAAKDAYESLKSRLLSHFRHQAEHENALAAFEGDPDHTAPALAAAVTESGAGQDPAVVDAARTLLAKADPDGVAAAKYSLIIKGNAQGVVQGDHNTITMNFGNQGPKT
jgi:hypothetical protein